jgi:hypothetical protein
MGKKLIKNYLLQSTRASLEAGVTWIVSCPDCSKIYLQGFLIGLVVASQLLMTAPLVLLDVAQFLLRFDQRRLLIGMIQEEI